MKAKTLSASLRGSLRAAIDLARRCTNATRTRAAVAGVGDHNEGNALATELEQIAGAVDFLAYVDPNLRFTYVSEEGLRFVGY
ncbi:MAG: hypothetical protein QOI13_2650, partial [Paraburkholderia sp.]|nr:hypothetical protein [Paraburkholderia sp.]